MSSAKPRLGCHFIFFVRALGSARFSRTAIVAKSMRLQALRDASTVCPTPMPYFFDSIGGFAGGRCRLAGGTTPLSRRYSTICP